MAKRIQLYVQIKNKEMSLKCITDMELLTPNNIQLKKMKKFIIDNL